MSRENDGIVKGLLIGLLAGGAIGAVVALLSTPKTGREMRSDIKSKMDDLMDEADTYVGTAKERSAALMSEARKRSESLVTDAKRKATSLMEDADKIITGVREKTGNLVEKSGQLKTAVKAGVDAFKEERTRP
jgi:gas vesicle protein